MDCISREINRELMSERPDVELIQYLRKQFLGYWPSLESTYKMIREAKKCQL